MHLFQIVAFSSQIIFIQQSFADSTSFVYVNGGCGELINFSAHEQDLLSFKNGLFKGKDITLFNAAGESAQVVKNDANGFMRRDSDGQLILDPSDLKDSTYPATSSQIESFFMRKDSSMTENNFTVVYGDHGGPQGVCLWDKNLGAKEIQKYYSFLSPKLKIRSLHIHCYAGASISNRKKSLPETFEDFSKFMNATYPANRCALALSNDDEVGKYYAWNQDWKESNWTKLFKQEPNPNLKNLKTFFEYDHSFSATPVLTSDYFLKDATSFFCKQNPSNLEVCSKTDLTQQIESLSKAIETGNKRTDQLYLLKKSMVIDWLVQTKADLMEEYNAASKKVESLRAEMALSKADESKKNQEQILELRKSALLKFEKLREMLMGYKNQGFNDYLVRNFTKDWVSSYIKRFPEFEEYFRDRNFKAAIESFFIMDNELSDGREKNQVERKSLMKDLMSERRLSSEIIFNDPNIKSLKERYENILECEDSSLN